MGKLSYFLRLAKSVLILARYERRIATSLERLVQLYEAELQAKDIFVPLSSPKSALNTDDETSIVYDSPEPKPYQPANVVD